MNNSNVQISSTPLLDNNSVPIYSFRGIEGKKYTDRTILNKEIIPNNGIIILNKDNVMNEESMVTAKMNINYSEVYKLILNPQIQKYHISNGSINDNYSSIYSELQNSLSDYINKQYNEMEKNIENYRKRLLLQFNSKKEKAGKEREALWNIICGVNADNSLNNYKKISFEPIIESDSLQSYHQQRSAYPIGSYTNHNIRRFNDNNQFFTYHSYKVSSMANYANNRAELRPDTKNIFDIAAIKKELSNTNIEKTSSNSLNENKSMISEEIALDQENVTKDVESEKGTSESNEAEVETQALSSSQLSKELNDNIEKIEVSNDNLLNENKDNDVNKNDATDDDIFLLDGFDEEDKKDKYISEELDEEYDQVDELVNVSSRYNQQNNFSIYATSMPIKIPERLQPLNNEESSSPDKENNEKEFTPPHIIIARTYQNDEALKMHPNHANKYFSVAY
ncbi:hypothetical protein BCR36DRAFT_581100 [Piromyces finnis]|uniref:Uncharacterized protein n=1 Tax=Piromyces finnis TaxID=1754191 RepID=A0A1Y1VGV6_9FUNG|nr:hypothetical protein BCR36DRAFT_581100 [Piromyces finnis]|eukprot:ORX55939.1 hypothetical protein BCR36DRAFT_581100 [Piromyces finnis]